MLEQIQPENINNKMCSAVTGAIYLLANKMKSVTELRVSINRKSLSFSLVGLLVLSLLSGCANPSGTSNPQMATAEAVIAHYDENVQQFQNSGESERLLTEIVEHNPYIAETSALVNFMPAENGLGGGFCSGGMFNINGINYVLTATHCMSQRITDTLKLSRPHLSDKLDIPAVIEAQRDFPDRDLTIMRVNTSGVSFPAYVAPSETVDPRNIKTTKN